MLSPQAGGGYEACGVYMRAVTHDACVSASGTVTNKTLCTSCPSPSRRCIPCFRQDASEHEQGRVNPKTGLCDFHTKSGVDAVRPKSAARPAAVTSAVHAPEHRPPVIRREEPRRNVSMRPVAQPTNETPEDYISRMVVENEFVIVKIATHIPTLLSKGVHRNRDAKTLAGLAANWKNKIIIRENNFKDHDVTLAIGAMFRSIQTPHFSDNKHTQFAIRRALWSEAARRTGRFADGKVI